MRRGLVNRLKQNYEVDLVQSVARFDNPNDASIIQQLDFDKEINIESEIALELKQKKRNFRHIESRMVDNTPKSKHLFHRRSPLESERNIERMINSKAKNKYEKNERNYELLKQQSTDELPHLKPKFSYEPKHHRVGSYEYQPLLLEENKQADQNDLKMKFEFKRSSVIKLKDFILQMLVPECPFCKSPMSEVFQESLVCSNRRCRQQQIFVQAINYPLLGLLYEMEIPSCSKTDLQDLYKNIEEEIQKIEKWRKSLIELGFEIQELIQLKQNIFQDKNAVKQLMVEVEGVKKAKFSVQAINDLQAKLIQLNLEEHYTKFSIWDKISKEEILNMFKPIKEKVEKFKPFSIKQVKNSLINEQATLNHSFSNSTLMLNTSSQLPYCFPQKLDKVFLKVDSSFQLCRQSFLLVQEINQLHISFHNKKTSRELRELFHFLPKSRSLYFQFDYKVHSHVSSEAFPLFSKLFQLPCEQLDITIHNGRPQTLQDLYFAASTLKPKMKLKIEIQLNHLLAQVDDLDGSEKSRNTEVMITLLEKCGKNLVMIELNIPIKVQVAEMLEYLINNDYSRLFITKFFFMEGSKTNSTIQHSFQQLIRKKNYILGLIIKQKRNPREKLREKQIREAVFNLLV